MPKIYILFFLILFFGCSKDASKLGQSSVFIKFYGGFDVNLSSKLALTKDGGYGMVGTYGTIEDKNQIYILNTDANGITLWQKIIGGKGNDYGTDLKIDKEGNFIVLGDSSYNSVVDSTVFYIIKLSSKGDIIWKKNYGSKGMVQQSQALLIVADGYILMGNSSTGSSQSVLLIKISFSGEIKWQKYYDVKSLPDYITSIQPTDDDNFIWSGEETRYRGSDPIPSSTFSNARITQTNNLGDILFDRTYLLTDKSYGDNIANDIKQIKGGFIVIGTATTGSSSNLSNSNKDIFVMNIFNDGSINWYKFYGSSTNNDFGQSIAVSNDGSYLITGRTNTTNNKLDIYLNKIDLFGNSIWEAPKTFGSINDDYGQTVLQTSDGGIIILATVNYSNIPVLTLIKTNSLGELVK